MLLETDPLIESNSQQDSFNDLESQDVDDHHNDLPEKEKNWLVSSRSLVKVGILLISNFQKNLKNCDPDLADKVLNVADEMCARSDDMASVIDSCLDIKDEFLQESVCGLVNECEIMLELFKQVSPSDWCSICTQQLSKLKQILILE
jgi:hypothetical protein